MLTAVYTVVAQGRNITGRVTSVEEPDGVPGVNVLAKGSTVGTITDLDGSYSLVVPEGSAALVFSFVGYMSQEVTIGTYQDKYSLSASSRTDGSSKFFRDVRWGNFWSVGGAWRIDEENFFNAGWVDMLKLRASYGEVGNDNLLNADGNEDYYAWQALYDLGFNNASVPGILQASLTAADLLWESNNTFDIGVDFNFFRRLSGNIWLGNQSMTIG